MFFISKNFRKLYAIVNQNLVEKSANKYLDSLFFNITINWLSKIILKS
jgi:hypothetical protein